MIASLNILAELSEQDISLIALIAGPALCLICLGFSLRANKRRRIIDNTPTSKTTGLFIGFVEVKGSAESDAPIRSYLAETNCVYYSYEIQEHWSRTVTESYTDSKGNRRTRTRRESGWKTVQEDTQSITFYLKDDLGVVRVNPHRAEIHADKIFSETCTRSHPLYYGKGPSFAVSNSDHRRRFVEKAIRLHTPLYIIGQSREREDIVAPEIAYSKQAPMYMISTKSEESISSGYNVQFWLLGILGLILIGVGMFFNAQPTPEILVERIATGVGCYLGAWILGWMWVAYNSLIDLRHRVDQGYSNVDVQLKRRHDLIPSIVEVVRGFKDHENTVQIQLAALRSQSQATRPGKEGPDPAGCAVQLRAIKEAYPELKANELFGDLQNQLVETEQRIALAREYYNSIVSFYNIRLKVVPDSTLSKIAGLKPEKFIEAKDFERKNVEINFAE